METTMNPAAITWDEIKKMIAEALSGESKVPERHQEDVVRRGEFRIFLWFNALCLTAILSSFVFVHLDITDLRVEMERQHADMRVEAERQYVEMRVEVERQYVEMRERIIRVEESIARVEKYVSSAESLLRK